MDGGGCAAAPKKSRHARRARSLPAPTPIHRLLQGRRPAADDDGNLLRGCSPRYRRGCSEPPRSRLGSRSSPKCSRSKSSAPSTPQQPSLALLARVVKRLRPAVTASGLPRAGADRTMFKLSDFVDSVPRFAWAKANGRCPWTGSRRFSPSCASAAKEGREPGGAAVGTGKQLPVELWHLCPSRCGRSHTWRCSSGHDCPSVGPLIMCLARCERSGGAPVGTGARLHRAVRATRRCRAAPPTCAQRRASGVRQQTNCTVQSRRPIPGRLFST